MLHYECIDSQFFKVVNDQNSMIMFPVVEDEFSELKKAQASLESIKQLIPDAYIIKVTNLA